MELLSPAGTLECGVAAFHYGADAVYLGMNQFSARADAGNFSFEDLAVLLGLAHQDPIRRRKVYVAVNTLLRDDELPALIELLAELRDLGVDALIVQDLGVYGIARRYFPELDLHASTQLAVHNVAGMLQAREMGFKRVIAAREICAREAAAMAAVPDIELEVFVHGALCHSYSGLCLLSSCLRGSSGNRGECSYLCRNSFRIEKDGRRIEENCALMSMKDLALGEMLSQLRKASVHSLKIEGRKKTPLYVAAVTNYYRKLLDHSFAEGEKEECERHIRTIFSREWCSFHWKGTQMAGVTDPQTAGPRGAEIGRVLAVLPGLAGQPDRLRFVLKNQVLEKHDGIQVDLNERERPFGFAVEEIRVFQQGSSEDGVLVFSAEPESTLEIPLPESHPRIPVGLPLFCTSSQVVKQAYNWPAVRPALQRKRHSLSFALQVTPDALEVTAQVFANVQVQVKLPLAEKLPVAQKPELFAETARKCFAKLGDSDFTMEKFTLQNPDGLFVPTAILNECRRQTVAEVEQNLLDGRQQLTRNIIAETMEDAVGQTTPKEPRWALKIDQPFYLNLFSPQDLQRIDELIFDLGLIDPEELPEALSSLAELLGRNRLRLALPVILRDEGSRRDWRVAVGELIRSGWHRWQIGNIGALALLREAGLPETSADLTADWPLYAMNRAAVKTLRGLGLKRATLSPDDTLENWSALLARHSGMAEILAYGDIPLAISAVCAEVSRRGFCPGKKDCDFSELQLTSRKGERLLAINRHCQTVYLNEQPFCLRGHLAELQQRGAHFFRADFLLRNYAPTQVKQIWDELMLDKRTPDAWNANLRFP
jgi:putative protease